MFENPRRGRQARNFTTNVTKILDLKSSSEQIFSENWRWVPLTHSRFQLGRPIKPSWYTPISLLKHWFSKQSSPTWSNNCEHIWSNWWNLIERKRETQVLFFSYDMKVLRNASAFIYEDITISMQVAKTPRFRRIYFNRGSCTPPTLHPLDQLLNADNICPWGGSRSFTLLSKNNKKISLN